MPRMMLLLPPSLFADMGSSAWDHYDNVDRPPLPLLHNTTIIEQPTDLGTLTQVGEGNVIAMLFARKMLWHDSWGRLSVDSNLGQRSHDGGNQYW